MTDNSLSLYLTDPETLELTVERLAHCRRPKEWVMHAIMPLYEEELLTYEVIHTRRFMAATVPHCTAMKHPSLSNLHSAMYKYFNIPKQKTHRL